MNKRLVRITVSYGKGDGEELRDQFLFEDTKEAREELIENEASWGEIYDDKQEFLDGVVDGIFVHLDGGDWDDPTGKFIAIYDKSELLTELKIDYDSEVAKVERLFEGGR